MLPPKANKNPARESVTTLLTLITTLIIIFGQSVVCTIYSSAHMPLFNSHNNQIQHGFCSTIQEVTTKYRTTDLLLYQLFGVKLFTLLCFRMPVKIPSYTFQNPPKG